MSIGNVVANNGGKERYFVNDGLERDGDKGSSPPEHLPVVEVVGEEEEEKTSLRR